MDTLYAIIREHGWVVYVGGARPTLIRGLWAKTFETEEAAIMYALDQIRKTA